MTDPRRWIKQVERTVPPELWKEAVGRARERARLRGSRAWRADLRPAPRLAALVTGIIAGALALVLVIVVASGGPPADRGRNTGDRPTRLPAITLEASLDDEPLEGTEVAVLPTGDADSELGFIFCHDCELPNPAAVVVGRDGSFWVADTHKQRIAHFAADGSFLGSIPLETGPEDLVAVGDRLYALAEAGATEIVEITPDGPGGTITVNHDGKKLEVVALIGGQDRLLVLIRGAERLLGGFWALAAVDPATGQVTKAPGVRTPSGTTVNLVPNLDARPLSYDVEWTDGEGATTRQELRFQLVSNGEARRTTVGDTYLRTATADGVATLVSIGDGQGEVQGVWYLEIPEEPGTPTFVRLPTYAFLGGPIRSLALGPDGHVYWMRLLEDGLHLYRR